MTDPRFIIRTPAEHRLALSVLAQHRAVCGPGCWNGDQLAEYVAEYESRTAEAASDLRQVLNLH